MKACLNDADANISRLLEPPHFHQNYRIESIFQLLLGCVVFTPKTTGIPVLLAQKTVDAGFSANKPKADLVHALCR
jgi:hypothetical protein